MLLFSRIFGEIKSMFNFIYLFLVAGQKYNTATISSTITVTTIFFSSYLFDYETYHHHYLHVSDLDLKVFD